MRYFIISIFILLLSSCKTTVPFTSTIKEDCGLSNDQLKHIQFFTSDKIILYKVKQESNAQINNGKIVVSAKKDAETIIIKKNTPCVLAETIGGKLLLSFESGDGKLLAFGTVSGGNYSLMAKSWEGNNGIIEYGHRFYQTNDGGVFLKVNMKKLNRLKNRYRYVKGRTIN